MSSLADLQANLPSIYMYDGFGNRIQRPNGNIDYTFMNDFALHVFNGAGNVSALSDSWKTAFREAIGLWSDIANLNFREISEGVPSLSIQRIGGTDLAAPNDGVNYIEYGRFGVAYYSELYVDQAYLATTPTPGTYAWRIAVHELGHLLSLTDTTTTPGFPAGYDSTKYTTMSYNGAHGGINPATPMLWDIYAVQQIFGANMSVRTGDTTYGFNSNAGRQAFDFNVNTIPVVTIWDAGGYDTLDLSGFSQSSTVILQEGEFSSVAGLTENIAIAFGTLIEGASGGSNNDSLTGNATDNLLRGNGGDDVLTGLAGGDVLRGGDGNDFMNAGTGADLLQGDAGDDIAFLSNSPENDTFFGDAGRDRVIYGGETQQITVNLGGGNGIANGASIGSDTLWDVEDVVGGDAGDVIVGNAASNIFIGNNGNDLMASGDSADQLYGGQGDDRLFGGEGDDVLDGYFDQDELNGFNGNDTITGGDGNDTVDDGAGNDSIDAGMGNDTVMASAGDDTVEAGGHFDTFDMSAATSAISVSLLGQFAQSSTTGNDGIFGFERVIGGMGGDTIFGDGGISILEGGGGNDLIQALGGSDLVNGGAGFDTASFETETGNLGVDLLTGIANGATSGADTLISVENVIGGFALDNMGGSNQRNLLDGREGDDILVGRGGNDSLIGGNGLDLLKGSQGDDRLIGEAGRDTLVGGAGNDAMLGGGEADLLQGNLGSDVLIGGAMADRLGGGDGADRFMLLAASDSLLLAGRLDVIFDFDHAEADLIDVSQIDARGSLGGNQAFGFIGNGAFSGSEGELRFAQRNGVTYVHGNTDGDLAAEFTLRLNGLHALVAGDLVL